MTSSDAAERVPEAWGLLDAEAQHAAFPDSFPIPDRADRDALRAGDMAKLVFVLDPPPASGPNAERMWVEVRRARPDGGYDGWLTNQPVVIDHLAPASIIVFESIHVTEIGPRVEPSAFDTAARAVVSARALAAHGPPGWVGREAPVDPTDSGWSVTAGDEDASYFDGDPARTTAVLSLADLVERVPALAEVFEAGDGEWVYREDHRRYVRLDDA